MAGPGPDPAQLAQPREARPGRSCRCPRGLVPLMSMRTVRIQPLMWRPTHGHPCSTRATLAWSPIRGLAAEPPRSSAHKGGRPAVHPGYALTNESGPRRRRRCAHPKGRIPVARAPGLPWVAARSRGNVRDKRTSSWRRPPTRRPSPKDPPRRPSFATRPPRVRLDWTEVPSRRWEALSAPALDDVGLACGSKYTRTQARRGQLPIPHLRGLSRAESEPCAGQSNGYRRRGRAGTRIRPGGHLRLLSRYGPRHLPFAASHLAPSG